MYELQLHPSNPPQRDRQKSRELLALFPSLICHCVSGHLQEWFISVTREALDSEGQWTAEVRRVVANAASKIDIAEASLSTKIEGHILILPKRLRFCLLLLIVADAVTVAAVFKSAGRCAASAGTSCGRYLSFQGDRQELSAEALALFAVERLLPPVLRAAGKCRALTENRSHRLLASLPPTLAVVVEEGNADEAALGPHADDPHEPLWMHLNRASTHQREGTKVLQTWISAHPADSSAAAGINGEKQSSLLSLVGALQPLKKRRDAEKSDVSLDPTFLSASGDELDAATPAGWKEEDKMSELLGALKALSRFGSEYGLFPAPSRKKADTGNSKSHSHGEAEKCTVSPLLSAIRAIPRAEPVKSFVMAFRRYKPACSSIVYPVSELCCPYCMCCHLLTVLRSTIKCVFQGMRLLDTCQLPDVHSLSELVCERYADTSIPLWCPFKWLSKKP